MPAKHAKKREKGTGQGLIGELRSLQLPGVARLQQLTSLCEIRLKFSLSFFASFRALRGRSNVVEEARFGPVSFEILSAAKTRRAAAGAAYRCGMCVPQSARTTSADLPGLT
jgi:hypothetical protein